MLDITEAPPLVTVDDLADLDLPVEFTEADLALACAIVRGACGWHVAPSVTVELALDSAGGRVLDLPSLHVTDVLEVRGRDGAVLDGWEHSQAGLLRREAGWPIGYGAVRARVTHGLPAAPADLVAVVADLARSRAGASSRPADLKSRTVGEVTYTYATAADTAGDPLGPYRHILWRYAR